MRRRESDGGCRLLYWVTIPFSILEIRMKLKLISVLSSDSNECVSQTYRVIKKNTTNLGATD